MYESRWFFAMKMDDAAEVSWSFVRENSRREESSLDLERVFDRSRQERLGILLISPGSVNVMPGNDTDDSRRENPRRHRRDLRLPAAAARHVRSSDVQDCVAGRAVSDEHLG